MGQRKIATIEKQYGDLNNVIPPLVNRVGQIKAASELKITQSTISRWLKDNGYTARIVYEKQQEQAS